MSIFTNQLEVGAYVLGIIDSYAMLRTARVKNQLKIFGAVILSAIVLFFIGDDVANMLLNAFRLIL